MRRCAVWSIKKDPLGSRRREMRDASTLHAAQDLLAHCSGSSLVSADEASAWEVLSLTQSGWAESTAARGGGSGDSGPWHKCKSVKVEARHTKND